MDMIENRTFDEIQIGESASLVRTLTRKDIDRRRYISRITLRRSRQLPGSIPMFPRWPVSTRPFIARSRMSPRALLCRGT